MYASLFGSSTKIFAGCRKANVSLLPAFAHAEAELLDELAVVRELQHLAVLGAVAGNPDGAFVSTKMPWLLSGHS